MWKKIVRILAFPLGAVFGVGIVEALEGFANAHPEWGIALTPLATGVIYGAAAVVFGLIFFLLSAGFVKWLSDTLSGMERGLSKMPFKELLLCVCGFMVGVIIAFLLTLPFMLFLNAPLITLSICIVLYASFALLGVRVARSRINEVRFSDDGDKPAPCRYVLDSSVIIDGRVVDIIELGFLRGEIIISNMVLSEIRRIADSDDILKRARGRRALDMLARLQGMKDVNLSIDETAQSEEDIDSRLVKLAGKLGADLVTNDYNLSRIGKMQNVRVLNLNDLSNAVKPLMLPGEEMRLQIVKEGKEPGQGVAYLEDGTMIVVEGGRRFISQEVDCVVTSVLQTSAGRMIFAKLKEA